MNLRKYDLNLLVVLDVLLDEANVTHAGKRLHLSQSATSAALEKLRNMFGDALLVRAHGGMELTAFARDLRAPLKRLLVNIEETVFQPGGFDPAVATDVFRIGMTDYSGLTLLPALRARLAIEAPAVGIEVLPVQQDRIVGMIEADQLDIGIAVGLRRRANLIQSKLLRESFSFVCHSRHPAAAAAPDIGRLLSYPYVDIVAHGDAASEVASTFARHGLVRNVAISVPYFAVALQLLADSNLVAILPTRLARSQAATHSLVVFDVPVELPEYDLMLTWHVRAENQPAQIWFRSLINRVAG